jgi:hypothetical protein
VCSIYSISISVAYFQRTYSGAFWRAHERAIDECAHGASFERAHSVSYCCSFCKAVGCAYWGS